eukprot:g1897.t1
MLDVLCQFLGSHFLPDQVKPAGLLVFAVVRACPEMAIPVVMPLICKKLLVHQPKSTVLPLHEAGVSESEAKWWLSLLCSAVRCGGASLLPHRHELEMIMRATFLDEREAVNKLGMKLLRRILYALTAVYVCNDYRLCNDGVWQTLMACRLGSTVPPPAGLTTLVWSGAQPPWWFTDAESTVKWHMPSEEEVAWARDLVFGVLLQVGEMLTATMGIALPALNMATSSWLAGLSTNLPSKKKLAHSAVLGIRLAMQILRGTCDLWPDERSNEELKLRQLPSNLKIAGDTAKVIFDWLSTVLLSAFKTLAAQEQYGSVAPTSGKLDPIDVSRVMRKLLKCVAELIGAFSDTHPSSLRLFPSLRHVEKHAAGLALQSTSLEMLHTHSRWRDLPRVWWVERVADTMENRLHQRRGGHRYQGRRRELIEELTKQIFSSGFSAVRSRAMETVAMAVQYHQGCRWPLIRDVLLPALSKETNAVLRCGTLTGDAADKEQQRLNDALSGLAASLAGGIQGLVWGVWRRGLDDASKLGYDLLEAVYAATRVGQSQAGDTKRCESCLLVSRQEEQAMDRFAKVAEGSGVVAAVLLDPDGDAAGRFGHAGACRAMASMMARHVRPLKRSRRLLGRQRRRRPGAREGWTPQKESPSRPSDEELERPSASPVDMGVTSLCGVDFFGRSKEKLDMSSWMAPLPEQLPISQVSIPGTHDSATFQMWPLPVSWEYMWAFGQTQDWDLPTQLAAGVRFFDLRVKADGWLYHGPMACSLTLEAALQTLPDLVKKLAKYLPLHFSRDLQLVGDMRGRMLVLQDWHGSEWSLRWAGPAMKVQDFWSPGSPKEKWVAIRKHLRGAPRRQGDRLCANFVSAHVM